MKREHYKGLSLVGHAEGIDTLLRQILVRVRQHCGEDAVVIISPDLIKIWWLGNSREFELERVRKTLNISPPEYGEPEEIEAWNKSLESFFVAVVGPLKDRTGGVAGRLYESDSPAE